MQTTSVKPSCAPHPSKRNENKDPANTEIVQKASVLPRVSRLPVPVKNLRLHTPSDFTQSHCKWEDKPLTVSNAFSSTFIYFFIISLFFVVESFHLLLCILCIPTGEGEEEEALHQTNTLQPVTAQELKSDRR